MNIKVMKSGFFLVGDRIADNFDHDTSEGDWYIGTIVQASSGILKVTYDTGDKASYLNSNHGLVLLSLKTPHSGKSVKSSWVSKYLVSPRKKDEIHKPNPGPVEPTKPPVVIVDEPKPPKPSKKRGGIDESKEISLVARVGSLAKLFMTANTRSEIGAGAQLKWLNEMWVKANHVLFGNKLTLPKIRRLKRVAVTSFRLRGMWYPAQKIIAISPNLFGASEEYIVLGTLVHEMCHQAVTDIDKVWNEPNKGHGPNWERWMHHCRLDPIRYSQYDNEAFFDDKTKKVEKDRKDVAQQDVEDREKRLIEAPGGKLLPLQLQTGVFAKFYLPKTSSWCKGVLVCPENKKALRWVFIYLRPDEQIGITEVPSTWFARLTPQEINSLGKTPEFWQKYALDRATDRR